jgi:hypothetical protein
MRLDVSLSNSISASSLIGRCTTLRRSSRSDWADDRLKEGRPAFLSVSLFAYVVASDCWPCRFANAFVAALPAGGHGVPERQEKALL